MILYYLRRNLPQSRPHAVFFFFKNYFDFPPPPPPAQKKKNKLKTVTNIFLYMNHDL